MFIGQYEHHLEGKGRLSIPSKFRAFLAGGAILAQGLDGCLFLYPKNVWEQLINKLSQLPLTRSDARAFTRSLSFGATEVETDSLGRILVPDYLRTFASLKIDCIIAGALERIEIWDKAKFEAYVKNVNAEDVAEKLDLP